MKNIYTNISNNQHSSKKKKKKIPPTLFFTILQFSNFLRTPPPFLSKIIHQSLRCSASKTLEPSVDISPQKLVQPTVPTRYTPSSNHHSPDPTRFYKGVVTPITCQKTQNCALVSKHYSTATSFSLARIARQYIRSFTN